MSEWSLKTSEAPADHSAVEQREMDHSLHSNNEVKNLVNVSTERYGDMSKIPDNENDEITERRSISERDDSRSVFIETKQDNDESSRKSRTERDASCFIGGLVESPEAYFITGSSYEGSWDALGMAGVGRYVMPNGTIYEGEIRDGMFHGHGSLYWSKNQRLDVVHLRGELKEYKYNSHDGLVYEEKNWNYCKFPDRRFHESIKNGLRPAGRTLKTQTQPTRILPPGCYDTGDGVYDPKTQRITSFDDPKKVLRIPLKDEREWILKKCRKSWTEPTGYRPDLNENWSDDPPELPYCLPLSQDSPDPRWQRITTFPTDRDFMAVGKARDVSTDSDKFRASGPEVCMCGQYIIIGARCNCARISTSSDGEEYSNSEMKFSSGASEEYCKDDEARQVFLNSSRDFSGEEIVKTGKATRLRKNETYKKMNERKHAGRMQVTDVDFSSTSVEFSKSFTAVSIKKYQDSRGFSTSEKVLQSSEKIEEQAPKNNTSLEESARKIVPEKSAAGIEKGNITDPEEFGQENSLDNGERTNGKNGKSKYFDTDQDEEQSGEENRGNEISRSVLRNKIAGISVRENSQKKDEDVDEINTSGKIIEGRISEKSVDRNYGNNVELLDDKQMGMLNENSEGIPGWDSSAGPDYGTDAVPRVKVSRLIEPEARNGRRSESKLFSKDLPEKNDEQTQSEAIEKKSERDLSYGPSNENTDKIVAHTHRQFPDSMWSIKKFPMYKNQTKLINNESGTTEYDDILAQFSINERITKSDEKTIPNIFENYKKLEGNESMEKEVELNTSYDENFLEAKLKDDKMSTREEIKVPNEENKKLELEEYSVSIVQRNGEATLESEIKWTPNGLLKSKTAPEETLISSERYNEELQSPAMISFEESFVASKLMNDEKSGSVVSATRKTVGSVASSEENLASLDKVHPSLVTLVSMENKLSKEKEMIEIYDKGTTVKSNGVWSLSGLNQDYQPKNKIEDSFFHSVLTASRSGSVQYIEKPCDSKLCKPTKREMRTSESRNRKDFLSNVSAKSIRANTHRISTAKK